MKMENKNILVVDDDPIILQICETNLQTEGYSVHTAENGEEALKSIDAFRPDLVVLDRMMPKLAGDEMLEELRKAEQTKNLPVIFLTAKGTMQDVMEGIRLGRTITLSSPFRFRNSSNALKKRWCAITS
jgi:DNA-binding response OmpR family regulator